MSVSSVLLPILGGGCSATVMTTGIGAVIGKVLRRIAHEVVTEGLAGVAKEADLKQVADAVAELKVKLASETGGNSNGLRQAVNDLTRTIGSVQADVAHMKGLSEGQALAAAKTPASGAAA